MTNLGYEPDRDEPLLISVIASKMSDNLYLTISKRFDSADSWDIEIILNASKTETTAREKTDLVSNQGENVRDEFFR